jgi:4-hydroxy-4-methyl-2-oxoglutarate aldolase
MIRAAVETCREGDVLVVAALSESTDGMFGDLLSVSRQAHGVAGLAIDAGVRAAQGTVKATAGSVKEFGVEYVEQVQ